MRILGLLSVNVWHFFLVWNVFKSFPGLLLLLNSIKCMYQCEAVLIIYCTCTHTAPVTNITAQLSLIGHLWLHSSNSWVITLALNMLFVGKTIGQCHIKQIWWYPNEIFLCICQIYLISIMWLNSLSFLEHAPATTPKVIFGPCSGQFDKSGEMASYLWHRSVS